MPHLLTDVANKGTANNADDPLGSLIALRLRVNSRPFAVSGFLPAIDPNISSIEQGISKDKGKVVNGL